MYGTMEGVAALAHVWTNNGLFDGTTIPTDSQVDTWLQEVSAAMDTALALRGFVVPITNASVILALQGFVQPVVADLCHAANSSGRFFTDNVIARGQNVMFIIRREIDAFVDMWAGGFAAQGAARNPSPEDAIFTRTADESGQRVVNLFQRKAFGETTQDWDT